MFTSDNQIFGNMYCGETRRDASSSVRGFLFQDLVAIDQLLGDATKYICSEYIEDVFVVLDAEICFMQAKYYPKTEPNMTSIMRDLYYQYLRLKLYGVKKTIKPVLCIHRKDVPQKPTISELQGYIGVTREKGISSMTQFHQWMKTHVYTLKKEDGQKVFFAKFAGTDSMKCFLNDLSIIEVSKNLKEYREYLGEKLNTLDFSGFSIDNKEMRQNILLGLAIQYIQETYNEKLTKSNVEVFEQRKCEKKDFIKYIEQNVCTEKESMIAAYLRSVVLETWEEIEKNNRQMTYKQEEALQYIRDNTANWLYSLGLTCEGQKQLLYTVSRDDDSAFENFTSLTISERRQYIHEHKECIDIFLRYLWKIMLSIVQELNGLDKASLQLEMFDPQTYFDLDEKRYLKAKFPYDSVKSSVVLSGVGSGTEWEKYRNILDRMRRVKPEKWFLKNYFSDGPMHGICDYDQDVAEIKENYETGFSVSSLSSDSYRIECMQCVRIDWGGWDKIDDCMKKIFSDNCIKEKKL